MSRPMSVSEEDNLSRPMSVSEEDNLSRAKTTMKASR